MQVPEQFKPIFRQLHQDISDIYPTAEAAIADIVFSLNLKQDSAAKAYFDDLISGKYNTAELDSLWRNSGAEIYFQGGDKSLTFLKLMRSMMD